MAEENQNQYDPVLLEQGATEFITDPRLAALYFGTAETPGFIQQLQQVGSRALQQGVPLRRTAGLSPLESAAIQQAYGGIGGYRPYLRAQEEALMEGIAAERRGGELMQPYFAQAEQQYGQGLGGLMQSFGQMGPSAREFQRASLVGFDPRSARGFYDPFEQQVVQKTISDVLQAGEMQDIQARARDIQSGGESAFGSRARLSAAERRRALGQGLGEALAGIRSGGYREALGRAQEESQFQRGALGRAAGFEAELGGQELAARRGYAGDILGLGGQRSELARGIGRGIAGYGGQLGQLGGQYQQMGQKERAELMQLGGVPRQLLETQYGREYEQQIRGMDRPLDVMGRIGQMLPQYQAGYTQLKSGYGAPIDPTLAGLQAGIGAYRGLYGLGPTQNPYAS